jgi:glycosyltransferase involved in cell wall biosynthesis
MAEASTQEADFHGEWNAEHAILQRVSSPGETGLFRAGMDDHHSRDSAPREAGAKRIRCMKIAIISLYLPSGSKIGVGYQAHAMANFFVAHRGWSVTMFSPCPKADDALYEQVVVPDGEQFRTFRFAWNLRHYDWSAFDVVHAHGDDNWLWFRKPVHIRTMHGSCLAEAWHIPGLSGKIRMTLLGISEIIASVAAHRTVAVSRNTQRSYPWIHTMIPNGVDTGNFRPDGPKSAVPAILFVGTYRNRKRGDLVMREFEARIRPVLPNAQLWMVCSDAPAAPGVTVFGRVPEEKLTELYRQAWVFTLPSSYEGFGVPYIEAMASGTPVVATPNPGAREVLEDGRYGRLVEPEQLGGAILELLQDETERLRMANLGLERAQIYQWSRVADRYAALYKELGVQASED